MRLTVQIQLRLSPEMKEFVKDHSSKRGWSMNSYINYLIYEDKLKNERENV